MQKFHNYKINVNFMKPIPYDLFNNVISFFRHTVKKDN